MCVFLHRILRFVIVVLSCVFLFLSIRSDLLDKRNPYTLVWPRKLWCFSFSHHFVFLSFLFVFFSHFGRKNSIQPNTLSMNINLVWEIVYQWFVKIKRKRIGNKKKSWSYHCVTLFRSSCRRAVILHPHIFSTKLKFLRTVIQRKLFCCFDIHSPM